MEAAKDAMRRSPGPEAAGIAAALLLLQAGVELVAALSLLVIRSGAVWLGFAIPALTFVLAFGLARSRGWARIGTALFEGLLLLGASLRLLVDGRLALDLVPVLTGFVLPLASLTLVLRWGKPGEGERT